MYEGERQHEQTWEELPYDKRYVQAHSYMMKGIIKSTDGEYYRTYETQRQKALETRDNLALLQAEYDLATHYKDLSRIGQVPDTAELNLLSGHIAATKHIKEAYELADKLVVAISEPPVGFEPTT